MSYATSHNLVTEFFESLNLIIPRIQGGGSKEDLGRESELYNDLLQLGVPRGQANQFISNVPTYWGNQPILEAPAYVGIVVFSRYFGSEFYIRSV